MPGASTVPCAHCGAPFDPTIGYEGATRGVGGSRRRRYCSRSCKQRASYARVTGRVVLGPWSPALPAASVSTPQPTTAASPTAARRPRVTAPAGAASGAATAASPPADATAPSPPPEERHERPYVTTATASEGHVHAVTEFHGFEPVEDDHPWPGGAMLNIGGTVHEQPS